MYPALLPLYPICPVNHHVVTFSISFTEYTTARASHQLPSALGNRSGFTDRLAHSRKNETPTPARVNIPPSHFHTFTSLLSYTTFPWGRPVIAHSFIPATISSALAPHLSFLSRVSAAGPAFATAHLRFCWSANTKAQSFVPVRTYAKRRMPPKKVVKEEKILLGRPGNNLKSGIVCRD